MREKLIQYVELLFAADADSQDMKEEILQNTLDRYEDLLSQGKTPEAAYRLAISGIGDIHEVLGSPSPALAAPKEPKKSRDTGKLLDGIAAGLVILSLIPVLLLPGVWGVCGMFALFAPAVVIVIANGRHQKLVVDSTPHSKFRSSLNMLIWAAAAVLYLFLSFLTGAWGLTWLLFPIAGTAQLFCKALLNYKEVKKHEK